MCTEDERFWVRNCERSQGGEFRQGEVRVSIFEVTMTERERERDEEIGNNFAEFIFVKFLAAG